MITKAIEIRDAATFIPAIATLMATDGEQAPEWAMDERYLLRRAGFNITDKPFAVLLCRMDADGNARQASYDPYGWGGARTLAVAHLWITDHWDEIRSGQVVDVEFILGETAHPKVSESQTSL